MCRNEHMQVCRVSDFSLSDLLQPVGIRFKDHLSAIINYLLFNNSITESHRVYKNRKV